MEESGLLIVLWSFISLCMTGVSILFYTKMHKQLFKLFRVFLLSPLTFLVLQFSVTVLCLNEAFRALVSVLLWVRYRGKAQLTKDGGDAVWEYKGKGNTRMVLVPFTLTRNAKLDDEDVVAELETRIFGDPKGAEIYKKLKSVITTFCGYVCWREDRKFSVGNHVRTHHRNELYRETDVAELMAELSQDMDYDKPQWEMVIIRRFLDEKDEQEKSIVIFRIHHAYMDGCSLLMMMDCLSDDYNYQLNPLTSSIPTWKMALYYTNAIIFGSLQCLQSVMNRFRTHWIKNELTFGKKNYVWSRNPTELETLQKIRLDSKASNANILALAFVESCRRVLPADRLMPNVEVGEIMALLPYPNSQPQNRFTAYSYSANISSDFVICFTLQERLKALKERAYDALMGPQPLVVYYTCKLVGRLPTFLFPYFLAGTQDSFYMSNVPCSKEKFTLFGGECEDIGAFPPCFNETGIMLATVGYKKSINICVGSDSSWLSKDEVVEILNEIPHVLKQLAEGASNLPELVRNDPVDLHDQVKEGKVSTSDSSDMSAKSQESLNKEDENQNQLKKGRVRSRKRKTSTKAL